MMTEAEAESNITVYGLPWSFPAWLYDGTNHSTCHTDWVGCVTGCCRAYIAEWVDGASASMVCTCHTLVGTMRVHGGQSGWRGYVPNWTSVLSLTKIVVGDRGPGGGFGLAAKLLPNSSVDISQVAEVVGLHYPVSIMPVAREPSTTANPFYEELWALPQRLWASEEYSILRFPRPLPGQIGEPQLRRRQHDSPVVWDMVWAWMDGLACSGQGLIWAGEPERRRRASRHRLEHSAHDTSDITGLESSQKSWSLGIWGCWLLPPAGKPPPHHP